MTVSVLEAIDVLVNIFIVLLLMKSMIEPREFYFNSALKPVDAITSPYLKLFEKAAFGFSNRSALIPIIGIIFILLLKSLFYFVLVPINLIVAIIFILIKFIEFYIQLMAFSLFVSLIAPLHSQNPIVSFFRDILLRASNLFHRLFKSEKAKLLGTFTIVFLCSVVIWNMMNVIGNHFVQSSSGIISQSIAEMNFNSVFFMSSFSLTSFLKSFINMAILSIGIYRYIVILLVVSALISWVSLDVRNPLINVVFILTEPVLAPVRRLVPSIGNIDISPMIVIFVIVIAAKVLINILLKISVSVGGL